MSASLPSPEEVLHLIRSRRTLKPIDMDADRDVPRATLERLLEAAHWAPNHGRTEPWRFHVFAGDSRKQLCEALPQIYDQVTPAGEIRPDKRNKLIRLPLLAPVIVAIVLHSGANPKIPEIEETEAVACAMQNLMLLAAAEGIGSFWSSPPLTYRRETADWLGLASNERCLGFLYLGYPAPGTEATSAGVRGTLADKIFWKEPIS